MIAFETFITARMARHAAEEAAHNSPEAVARRAVYTLSSVLMDMGDAEAVAILTLIDDEIVAPIAAREA